MIRRLSHNSLDCTGHKAGVRRLVPAFCAAVVLVFAEGLLAAGTGTVDRASGWYPVGTNLTAVATPGVYSVFDGWTGDTNGAAIASTQISFNVTAPRVVAATFSDRLTATNSVPYWWLASVGVSNNFESAVAEDPDGDTFTTAEEYWSGTDPNLGSSHLRITAVEMFGTNVRLVWAHSQVDPDIPPICVQSRASMSTGSWVYAGQKAAAEGTNTWDSMQPSQLFYRLCVTNVP